LVIVETLDADLPDPVVDVSACVGDNWFGLMAPDAANARIAVAGVEFATGPSVGVASGVARAAGAFAGVGPADGVAA
jgi:hypothetical protein